MHFRFIGRHLESPTSGNIGRYSSERQRIPRPRKWEVSRWNDVAILSRNWATCTSGLGRHFCHQLERMHVKNSPIASGMLPWFVLCFKTSLYLLCYIWPFFDRPMQYRFSHWNFVAVLSECWDISTSCLAAAIFKCRLPVTSGSNHNSAIEFLDHINTDLAVGFRLYVLQKRRYACVIYNLHIYS